MTPDPTTQEEQEVKLKPCPFCGSLPKVFPDDPIKEGNAWARVACVNPSCVSQPEVFDGESVADERGSDAYKAIAIQRWNTRATQPDREDGKIVAWLREHWPQYVAIAERRISDAAMHSASTREG